MNDLVFFLKFLYGAIKLRMLLWLAFIVVAALLDGLTVGLFLPLLVGDGIDNPLATYITRAFDFVGLEYSLSIVIGLMVILYLLRTGFLVLQEIYATRIVTRLLVQLKCDLVERLFKADYRYFTRHEVGYFTNAVTIEYNNVAFAFEMCMTLLVSLGFAAIYVAMPLAVNWTVTLVVLGFGIPAYFLLQRVNKLTREYSLIRTSINARLQSYVVQAFHNFKYLKATASGDSILQKIFRTSESQGDVYFRQSVLSTAVSRGTELISLLLVAGFLFYNVVLMNQELLAVLFLLFLIRRAITHSLGVQIAYRKFLGASGSVKVFQRMQAELMEHREEMLNDGVEPDFSKALHLTNVSMTYNGENYVLRDINMTIPPRSTVALVGMSGAGKSTLVTLLTGVLKPTEGTISLGDTSYQEINQRSLRKSIGYVTQETVIFNDTIRNNITLSNNNVPDEKVMAAAKRAFLTDFIEALPAGYETIMGDDGVNISGGQRQRISIARELFKDAKLLMFDEATSSLDTHSEREIQRNIEGVRGEKTVVIIAHRMSTVQAADMIFVLDDGAVAERGTYDELYSRGGLFKTMVDQQTLSDNSGAAATQASGYRT